MEGQKGTTSQTFQPPSTERQKWHRIRRSQRGTEGVEGGEGERQPSSFNFRPTCAGVEFVIFRPAVTHHMVGKGKIVGMDEIFPSQICAGPKMHWWVNLRSSACVVCWPGLVINQGNIYWDGKKFVFGICICIRSAFLSPSSVHFKIVSDVIFFPRESSSLNRKS